MAKNGNITGQVFDEGVINQIEARQNFLGARYKYDPHLIYGNNNNAFLRLASSINVGANVPSATDPQQAAINNLISQGQNQLKARGINETFTGAKLAQACVLFGGTVGVDNSLNPSLKFGVYGDSSLVDNDPIGTIAAYGWGGIGSKGFVPMPAIQSADVSFFNRGALAKATVKIKVYSVEQLQIFDILYFRIGYTMLLEWGHNIWLDSKKAQLPYDPLINPLVERKEFVTKPFELFFKEGTTQQDIIKAIKQQRLDECYNYDAMLGKVTNFTWKFNDDGSYDIDLNLVGLGDIIETLKVNATNAANLKQEPTPSQVRNKKKSAIDKQKKTIADNKAKAPTASQAAKKAFTDALSNYNTYAGNTNLVAYIDTSKEIALDYEDANAALYDNADINKVKSVIFNLSENSPFTSIQDTVFYAKERFLYIKKQAPKNDSDILDEERWVKGIEYIINTLVTLYGKLGDLSVKQGQAGIAENEAQNSQAQADAELKALEGALQQVAKEEEIAQLSPDTSVESKNKTALNTQLYNWRQEAIKGSDKDNLLKLTFTANSANPTTTGASTLSLNFYYVRLGHLLKWIQNNLLYYDNTKKADDEADVTNKKLGNPIFEIDYSSEYNFCLRFPSQFSSDPRVCVIPSKYKDENTSWDILPELKGYFVDDNQYAGRLMNIFVNVDYTARCLDSNTDVNGKANLLKFLTSLLDGVNDSLGNVNKLEPVFDSETNALKIIEGSSLEKVEALVKAAYRKDNKMATFQSYGIGTNDNPKGSFLTNVDFQVQLPPNMASMATISAQAGGNIVGENATGLSKLNGGFTDRLISVKLDASSIEGSQTGKADPKTLFKNNIQYVGKAVNSLYKDKKFATDTIESVRSVNRDISLYLTGNDAINGTAPAPFFIPFNLSLNMKGLSGMKNYERFAITEEILPYSYRPAGTQGGVIDFLIKGISHTISNNEWTTKIESLTVSSNRKV